MIAAQLISRNGANLQARLRKAVGDGKVERFVLAKVKGGLVIRHESEPGKISFATISGALCVSIRCKNATKESILLEAFVGSAVEQLGDDLAAINVQFGDGALSRSGLGKSTSRPRGRKLILPTGIKFRGKIRGSPKKGKWVGSGEGHVNVGIRLTSRNDADANVVLPAGWTLVSKDTGVQNGILVQAVAMTLRARATTLWRLRMYCANHGRFMASQSSTFLEGKVVEDRAFHELFDILAGKTLKGFESLIQEAVWEISDERNIKLATRRKLMVL